MEDYSKEVKFQVGNRVSVEIELVPKEERDCTIGIITSIKTKFHRTPSMRKILYTVHFDDKRSYVKKEFQMYGSIKHILIEGKYLSKC